MIMTQRQGEAQKEEIRVKTEVELFKNRKEAELAEYKAELATKNAGWSQASQLAEVESTKAVTLREAELQTEVEKKKVLTQTEKLRGQLLSKAAVDYETKVYLMVTPICLVTLVNFSSCSLCCLLLYLIQESSFNIL